ncbi:MAG TPA: DUF6498-containing protein [Ignavibacteriaceae bacterium]|nr:DUF6498-containing protein [Ignavibacteriaceae bacterium]
MSIKGIKREDLLSFLKNIKGDKTSYSIILYNLFPIIGVLYFDWDPIAVVFIYIAETIVIGVFNLFKIAIAKKDIKQADGSYKTAGHAEKLFMVVFFLIHYNAFNYGQITIISSSLPGINGLGGGVNYFISYFTNNLSMQIGLGLIVIVNLYSFIHNYIGGKQYNIYSPLTLLFLPYGRIFLQQFVGIFGVFFVEFLSLPFFFLIILQVIKTIGELVSHLVIEGKIKGPIELSAMDPNE